jgi:hypothetical protein
MWLATIALRCVARGPAAQGRAFETVLYAALKGRSFTEHEAESVMRSG